MNFADKLAKEAFNRPLEINLFQINSQKLF